LTLAAAVDTLNRPCEHDPLAKTIPGLRSDEVMRGDVTRGDSSLASLAGSWPRIHLALSLARPAQKGIPLERLEPSALC
jgi:hypothetical protein